MGVRNYGMEAGRPWTQLSNLASRPDLFWEVIREDVPSSKCRKRSWSCLMDSVCSTCCFMFTFNLASMRSHSCEYCCVRSSSKSAIRCCPSAMSQSGWVSGRTVRKPVRISDFDIGLGIISRMCRFRLLPSIGRGSTPRRGALSKISPTVLSTPTSRRSLFCHTSSEAHTR